MTDRQRRFDCAIPGCHEERAVLKDPRNAKTYESSQCLGHQGNLEDVAPFDPATTVREEEEDKLR